MYCIYTDSDVPENKGNWDHIIPLSLGGADQFVIWSDRDHNSILGSKVDGALKNDPLMELQLGRSSVAGHSGKPTEPRWRKVTMGEKPIQMTFSKDEIKFWDARERKYINKSEVAGKDLQVKLQLNRFTAIRFVTKVALGGGYFLYGDNFKNAVDCKPLRSLIMLDPEPAKQRKAFKGSKIKLCDRFHKDSQPGGKAHLHRLMCESTHRSIFIAVPHDNAISFHVGIVGSYVGLIIVPAKSEEMKRFPLIGDHDLGHAIVLAPGIIDRLSYRELTKDFYRALTGKEPPAPPE